MLKMCVQHICVISVHVSYSMNSIGNHSCWHEKKNNWSVTYPQRYGTDYLFSLCKITKKTILGQATGNTCCHRSLCLHASDDGSSSWVWSLAEPRSCVYEPHHLPINIITIRIHAIPSLESVSSIHVNNELR